MTVSDIDWDRLQPLQVVAGSHQPGSGKGCAMNVVSYITGDMQITDIPACSARTLAKWIQGLNDMLAGPKFPYALSPEDAIAVIELGMLTVGTAELDSIGSSYPCYPSSWDKQQGPLWREMQCRRKNFMAAKAYEHRMRIAHTGDDIGPRLRSEIDELIALTKQQLFDTTRDWLMGYRQLLGLEEAPVIDRATWEACVR